MSEPQEIVVIGKNELMGRVAQLFAEGYRLVQIGCNTLPDGYELNYSFDEGYRFKNLRILAAPGEEVPSIGNLLLGQALALAQVGETEAAIERLSEMLARPVPPYGASVVWCHPLLRPLRADPRFRRLIAEHGGNVAIDPHDRSTWPRSTDPGAE